MNRAPGSAPIPGPAATSTTGAGKEQPITMQGYPRSAAAPAHRMPDDEWDAEAEQQSEIVCVNVSPYVARFKVGTVPGSKPRFITVRPDGRISLQAGYCMPFLSPSRKEVQPTVESLSSIEAWPGKRIQDKDGKWVWEVQPGPVLPMVCSEERADMWRARWEQAMAQREAAAKAPLVLNLTAADGRTVPVQAMVPQMPRRPVQPVDEEDMSANLEDDPPPDLDAPIEPVTVTAAPAVDGAAPASPVPMRGENPPAETRRGRGGRG